MDANENKSIGCEDGLLEDTEDQLLLLGKKSDFIWGGWLVCEVKDVLNVLSTCSGEDVAMPCMLEMIFLERLVVTDTTFDAFLEVMDDRRGGGDSRSARSSGTGDGQRLSAPGLKAIGIKIEPSGDWRRRNKAEPKEKRDDVEALVLVTIRGCRE
jgi:hypothetical protein